MAEFGLGLDAANPLTWNGAVPSHKDSGATLHMRIADAVASSHPADHIGNRTDRPDKQDQNQRCGGEPRRFDIDDAERDDSWCRRQRESERIDEDHPRIEALPRYVANRRGSG